VQLLQWATNILILRLLTPVDYGVMASAALFTGLVGVLADSGLGRALVQRQKLTDRDFGAVLTVSVLISWTLFAILLVAAPRFESLLGVPKFAAVLCASGLTVLLVPFQTLGVAWLERELAFNTQSIIQVTTGVVQTVCVLLFALADFGVWALAGMAVVMLWFEELTVDVAPIGRILLVCCAGVASYIACMLLSARHTIVEDARIVVRDLRSWRVGVRQAPPRAPGH